MTVLAIKLLQQVDKEHLHDRAVGVGLEKREVDPTSGIKASNHANARLHVLHRHRVLEVAEGPLALPKVHHSKPRLVDVDDNLLKVVYLQEVVGKLVP